MMTYFSKLFSFPEFIIGTNLTINSFIHLSMVQTKGVDAKNESAINVEKGGNV